mmetsp:Transcript_82101/g.253826  ORF Transcript_82101/g.253826 Transcript_82101/m.253826 type:complete len:232 (+) Transcript_82101:622-1317(+)
MARHCSLEAASWLCCLLRLLERDSFKRFSVAWPPSSRAERSSRCLCSCLCSALSFSASSLSNRWATSECRLSSASQAPRSCSRSCWSTLATAFWPPWLLASISARIACTSACSSCRTRPSPDSWAAWSAESRCSRACIACRSRPSTDSWAAWSADNRCSRAFSTESRSSMACCCRCSCSAAARALSERCDSWVWMFRACSTCASRRQALKSFLSAAICWLNTSRNCASTAS